MQIDREKIRTKFPYLSIIVTSDKLEFTGVILSHNKNTVSFIDIDKISSKDKFTKLIELCQQWWWYSNRMIPINLYYYDDMQPYMGYISHVSARSSEIIGYSISLETVVEVNKYSRRNRTLKIIE